MMPATPGILPRPSLINVLVVLCTRLLFRLDWCKLIAFGYRIRPDGIDLKSRFFTGLWYCRTVQVGGAGAASTRRVGGNAGRVSGGATAAGMRRAPQGAGVGSCV